MKKRNLTLENDVWGWKFFCLYVFAIVFIIFLVLLPNLMEKSQVCVIDLSGSANLNVSGMEVSRIFNSVEIHSLKISAPCKSMLIYDILGGI